MVFFISILQNNLRWRFNTQFEYTPFWEEEEVYYNIVYYNVMSITTLCVYYDVICLLQRYVSITA